jgi:murein DD-endopeptidase MepM/ murein hydrolase activator NlpD
MPGPPASVAARVLVFAARVATVLLAAALLAGVPSAAGIERPLTSGQDADPARKGWVWPAEPFRLARAYVAPAHEYGPGHRGIDLDLLGGTSVRAPADGVVAFSGSVAGRSILTIDHGDGLVTTLEPVDSAPAAGSPVVRGEPVATLSIGGHAAAGLLHFGVRLHGEYINPVVLLGRVPRAILLPCCD